MGGGAKNGGGQVLLLSRKVFTAHGGNARCNIHFTRGNKPSHPAPDPLKKRKDTGQIYTTELNGQGFYLFMRGRSHRNNNADPAEEILLPFV